MLPARRELNPRPHDHRSDAHPIESPSSATGDLIRTTINSFNSFDICRLLFYFNKLSFEKTFICKVERLDVKQVDPD